MSITRRFLTALHFVWNKYQRRLQSFDKGLSFVPKFWWPMSKTFK
jgi:hypothetical protein